jgi:hypothetical protein
LARSGARLGILAVVAAALFGLAGCTVMSTSTASSSCTDMASGACDEQVELWGQRFPGAASIDIACHVPDCSRAGGAGTVVVTLPDGQVRRETFSYTGDPNPPPQPTCARIAAEACERIAEATWGDQRPSRAVVALDVTCEVPQCTADSGQVEVIVRFADGSSAATHHGWEELP